MTWMAAPRPDRRVELSTVRPTLPPALLKPHSMAPTLAPYTSEPLTISILPDCARTPRPLLMSLGALGASSTWIRIESSLAYGFPPLALRSTPNDPPAVGNMSAAETMICPPVRYA
ncbi:hypothetical protein G6F63_015850 [Rhizopus arrhizus]|nr:hypothetical protein G6F63_015850 [Rhizopus arrhizus]